MDCPILYLASHKAPNLRDVDFENLRHFVEAGGLLFTHSDGNSEAFNKWVAGELVPKVCPGYVLQSLPDGDPIFSINYPIRPPHMKIQGVSNGSRLLIVHSATDLAAAWQQRSDKTYRDNFRFGINLFCYAAGKVDLRNRLATPLLPDSAAPTKPATTIVRLSYPGKWNPEPYAWTRFGRSWQSTTGSALEIKTDGIENLAVSDAPICHLTGAEAHSFTEVDARAIREYVNGGGILLIDACGGSPAFLESAQKLLASAFPSATLQDLPANHAIYKDLANVPGTVKGPRLRPFYAIKMSPPPLRLLLAGKGSVILSTIDISTGLLDTNTYTICGYTPESCQTLAENAVAWAHGVTLVRSANPMVPTSAPVH
jgi:hypothetical protein